MNAADLLPFVVLGLAGSLHCAGMCGPLAIALGVSQRRASASSVAFYVAGKALVYSMLALGLALGAAELGRHQPEWLAVSRGVLAWLAGIVMVLVALGSLGWLRGTGRGWLAPLERVIRPAFDAARELPGPLRGFAFGIANGLLPCGLSWSAIALGAAGGGELALAGPFVFGLATGPVLASLALGGGAIPGAWRERASRIAAVCLLAYGVWTLARGGAGLGASASSKVLPECCTEAVEGESNAAERDFEVKGLGPDSR